MKNYTALSLVAALTLSMVGCDEPQPEGQADGRDDAFLGGGKADGGVEEGTADAAAVLAVANEASLEVLDDDVPLDRRAATGIYEFRLGPDGTEGTDDDRVFETLAQLDAIPYVGPVAFQRLLTYAREHHMPEPELEAVDFVGSEQCSGQNEGGTSYTHYVISNPPQAETDLRLSLRFNSSSPYSPRSHAVQLQVGANEWISVFSTLPAVSNWQQQTFTVDADLANDAMASMGWLRFRVNPGTAYTACNELSVVYNCPECFACPEGQEDVGFGCQDIGAPFDQTLLDNYNGACGQESDELTFVGAPEAGGDGELGLDYLLCEGGRIEVAIETQNAGWVDLGTDTTALSCGFDRASLTIPEAYLDAARTDDGEIRIRYDVRDNCSPGMGCSFHNDPCIRRVNLTFEQ